MTNSSIFRNLYLPLLNKCASTGWFAMVALSALVPVYGGALGKFFIGQEARSRKDTMELEVAYDENQAEIAEKAADSEAQKAEFAIKKADSENKAATQIKRGAQESQSNRIAAAQTQGEAATIEATTEAAEKKSDTQTAANVAEIQTQARVNVKNIEKKSEMAKERIKIGFKQQLQLDERENEYKQIEIQKGTEVGMIKLKGAHYKSISAIQTALTQAAQATKGNAEENSGLTAIAEHAVRELIVADTEVYEAHQQLSKALHEFEQSSTEYLLKASEGSHQLEQTIKQGESNFKGANSLAEAELRNIEERGKIDTDNKHKVIDAFMDFYKAEQGALTKLKIDCGKQKSGTLVEQEELKYAEQIQPMLDEQLAARRALLNLKVDEKLSGFHLLRLEALSKEVDTKISQTQKKISQDPQNHVAHKQDLDNLTKFAERIKTIAAQKPQLSLEQAQEQELRPAP